MFRCCTAVSPLWVLLVALVLFGATPSRSGTPGPRQAEKDMEIETRVEDVIAQLTLDEKIDLLSGKDNMDTRGVPRLGVPPLKMTDGPHGVRWEKATCFPTGLSMASTWNPVLIERMGVSLAEETLARGRNMLLGPCVNIHRTPLGGRNFESFGEDPYLAGRTAVAYVRGVQSRGVATSTKHFAANNQEFERGTISVEIDERALREIYLPAFKAAVTEGHTWTVMTAYNKVNGTHCSANAHLLNDILKGDWGFDGFTVSDWGALHETARAAASGQDLEMPGPGTFFGRRLADAVENGAVGEDVIDEMVRRILRITFRVQEGSSGSTGSIDTPEHRQVARDVARESITLLKNENSVLPFDPSRIKHIAVIGPNAAVARNGGGGSSSVDAFYLVSPLDGLRQRCGEDIEVHFAAGCNLPGEVSPIPSSALRPPEAQTSDVLGLKGEYFDNRNFEGNPVFTRIDPSIDFQWTSSPGEGIGQENFSARWTGRLIAPADGTYALSAWSDDGSRIYLDGKLLVDNWGDHGPMGKEATLFLKKGEPHDLRVDYYQAWGGAEVRLGWAARGGGLEAAANLAADCDTAVVCIGLSHSIEGEGVDRTSMDLPGEQAALIEAVAEANPNTVVVFIGGSPVTVQPWLGKVPAVLAAWYPGSEGGHALAEILFGDINPSGSTAISWPHTLDDVAAQAHYPGSNGQVQYQEGIYVGYRHFDTHGIDPVFPFGHGLSYTEFAYSDLAIDADNLRVRFRVENTGKRLGKETVQLYVHDVAASIDRPAKELKRFAKIELEPGQQRDVSFELSPADLAFYHTEKASWVVEPGEFELLVGSSSRDIRLRGRLAYEGRGELHAGIGNP